MHLIVGLGNPGSAYKWTRHNTGFEVVSKLAFDHGIAMTGRKCRAVTGSGIISGKNAMLAMPMTFMNLSGESVRDLLNYYDLTPESLIIVYDDADLGLSEIRVRRQGSAGGHNGMKNIIYHLETDEFTRVRVGIGEKPSGWELADYVLSKFKDNERDDIIDGITHACVAVEIILSDGVTAAMNAFNKKSGADNNSGNL